MKIKRRDLDNVFLTLLVIILCSWAFFSGISISGFSICSIVFVLEAAIIVVHGGKIEFRRIYLLWIFNIVIMFVHADRMMASVLAFNITYAILVLLVIITASYSENKKAPILLQSIVFFSLVSCAIIVVESILRERVSPFLAIFLTSEGYYNQLKAIQKGIGYSGLASVANVISYSAAILIFYNIYFLSRRDKIVRIGILLLAIYSVLVVGERSNIVFMPLAIMAVYYLGANRNKANRFFKILFIGLFAIGIIILISPFLTKYNAFLRIVNSFDTYASGGDISNGRDRLYVAAFDLWKARPLLGNGWFYYFYENVGVLRTSTYSHVHNLILELLCDTGIIGTVLFLSSLVFSIFLNIRLLKKSQEEYNAIFKFTLAFQLFFLMDCMLHVAFYSMSIIVIYFIVIAIFYSSYSSYSSVNKNHMKR